MLSAKEAHREYVLNKAIQEYPPAQIDSLLIKYSNSNHAESLENIKANMQNLIFNLNLAMENQEKIKKLTVNEIYPEYDKHYQNLITAYTTSIKIMKTAYAEVQTILEGK